MLLPFLPVFTATLGSIAAHPAEELNSAFLPAVGQTTRYAFVATTTLMRFKRTVKATLSLARPASDQLQVTVSTDGGSARTLHMHIDRTGAVETPAQLAAIATSDPYKPGLLKSEVAALWVRFCLTTRICRDPGSESSFPVQLGVPWAVGPVMPNLAFKSTDEHTFIADAETKTSVNLPGGIGTGWVSIFPAILAGPVLSLTGKVSLGAGLSGIVDFSGASGPTPTDVKLHLTGELRDGRLKMLSAEQEDTIHGNRGSRKLIEDWQFTRADTVVADARNPS
jgi:hypothetical protein